jgi:hypothetical protein
MGRRSSACSSICALNLRFARSSLSATTRTRSSRWTFRCSAVVGLRLGNPRQTELDRLVSLLSARFALLAFVHMADVLESELGLSLSASKTQYMAFPLLNANPMSASCGKMRPTTSRSRHSKSLAGRAPGLTIFATWAPSSWGGSIRRAIDRMCSSVQTGMRFISSASRRNKGFSISALSQVMCRARRNSTSINCQQFLTPAMPSRLRRRRVANNHEPLALVAPEVACAASLALATRASVLTFS